MTLDRSLKVHGGLARQRSVLTRAERVVRLIDDGNFDPEAGSPLGLPKTKVRHSKAGMKTKKAAEAAGGEAAAEAGAAPATGEKTGEKAGGAKA